MNGIASRAAEAVKAYVRAEPVRVRNYILGAVTAGAVALAGVGIPVPDAIVGLIVAGLWYVVTEWTRAKVTPVSKVGENVG